MYLQLQHRYIFEVDITFFLTVIREAYFRNALFIAIEMRTTIIIIKNIKLNS